MSDGNPCPNDQCGYCSKPFKLGMVVFAEETMDYDRFELCCCECKKEQDIEDADGSYKVVKEAAEDDPMRLICCLCGSITRSFGNNASPVEKGRCCDTCNTTKVIPARFLTE